MRRAEAERLEAETPVKLTGCYAMLASLLRKRKQAAASRQAELERERAAVPQVRQVEKPKHLRWCTSIPYRMPTRGCPGCEAEGLWPDKEQVITIRNVPTRFPGTPLPRRSRNYYL